MVTKVRKMVGSANCWNPKCGREVPVTEGTTKEGGPGALSIHCGYCGFPAYVKRGTKAHRDLMAVMKPCDDDAEQAPAAPAAAAPARAPAPAPAPADVLNQQQQKKPAAPARATIFG